MLSGWVCCAEFYKRNNIEPYSSNARILGRDLAENDIEAALFHYRELSRLAAERKRELDNIFSSRSWRIATCIARLLGRK